jgi:hypothetical protein
MFCVVDVRLRRTTARLPLPERTLPYTWRPVVSSASLTPWRPRGSWSTAMTSGLVRMFVVSVVRVVRSRPASSGAPEIAHRFMWERLWAAVRPFIPTTIMSGSL